MGIVRKIGEPIKKESPVAAYLREKNQRRAERALDNYKKKLLHNNNKNTQQCK